MSWWQNQSEVWETSQDSNEDKKQEFKKKYPRTDQEIPESHFTRWEEMRNSKACGKGRWTKVMTQNCRSLGNSESPLAFVQIWKRCSFYQLNAAMLGHTAWWVECEQDSSFHFPTHLSTFQGNLQVNMESGSGKPQGRGGSPAPIPLPKWDKQTRLQSSVGKLTHSKHSNPRGRADIAVGFGQQWFSESGGYLNVTLAGLY